MALLCYSWLLLLLVVVISCSGGGEVITNHSVEVSSPCDHANLTRILHDLVLQHSSIASLTSIGNSSQGRALWVMRVGDSVNLRPVLRPQVKLVGNVNGFSGPACATLLSLVQRLLIGFRKVGTQERRLLQALEVHILFDMNPDGSAAAKQGSCLDGKGRSNGAGVDLNRDFPLVFPTSEEEYHYSHHNLQPETAAVMRWSLANNFVLSLSLISGQAMLVLPFDDRLDLMTSHAHETPDNDIFTRLADKYVAAVGGHTGSWNCANLRRNFPKGWVNGAEWYPARGTMMDWSYVRAATPEITVGLHCCRNPGDEATLLQIATRHERGIYALLVEAALGGIRGQVVDTLSHDVLEGALMSRVDSRGDDDGLSPLFWFTSRQGEFWRLLPPGRHTLQVTLDGYRPTRVQVNVGDEPTVVNIHLMPISLTTTTTPSTTISTTISTTTTVLSTSDATTSAEEQNSSPTLNYETLSSNSSTESTTNTKNKKVKIAMREDWGPKMQGFHRGLSVMLAELSSRSSSSSRTPTPPPRFVSIPFFLLLYIFSYFIQHPIY